MAACAAAEPHYIKANANPADSARVLASCRAQVIAVPHKTVVPNNPPPPINSAQRDPFAGTAYGGQSAALQATGSDAQVQDEKLVDDCMAQQGWQRQ